MAREPGKKLQLAKIEGYIEWHLVKGSGKCVLSLHHLARTLHYHNWPVRLRGQISCCAIRLAVDVGSGDVHRTHIRRSIERAQSVQIGSTTALSFQCAVQPCKASRVVIEWSRIIDIRRINTALHHPRPIDCSGSCRRWHFL